MCYLSCLIGISLELFPPRLAAEGKRLLDVNLIHYILAVNEDIKALTSELDSLLKEQNIDDQKIKYFRTKFGIGDRYDNSDTVYFKRMLQHVLDEEVRGELLNRIFNNHFHESQEEFAKQLYMNINEVSS